MEKCQISSAGGACGDGDAGRARVFGRCSAQNFRCISAVARLRQRARRDYERTSGRSVAIMEGKLRPALDLELQSLAPVGRWFESGPGSHHFSQ
jgi:hypothetical protein